MKSELQEKLFSKYPKIFGDRTKPKTETCMCWGLEVGDGWYDLIDVLCEALTYTYSTSVEVNEEDGKRLGVKPYNFKNEKNSYYFQVQPPQVIATQVKEKYGTLHFYHHIEFNKDIVDLLETEKYPELQKIVDRYNNYIDGIIHFADIASGRTCETTGQLGEMHVSRGWYKTLNRDYAKTIENREYIACADLPKKTD
jgi:hypothetical protein